MKVSLKYQEKLFSVIVFKLISLSIQSFLWGGWGGGRWHWCLLMFFELIIIGWLVIGSGRIFEVGCLIT